MTPLPARGYLEQAARWPRAGRHILAHSDASSIIVYQAYRASIARYALAHGAFGGPEFSFSRMSWIKPNFLAYATTEVREIIDMTPFVTEQRAHARQAGWADLQTPVEDVYRLADPVVAANIGLDGVPGAA